MSQSHGHKDESAPVAHGDHAAEGHGAHEMHMGLYWGIGGFLVCLTGFTVFLSYVNFGSRTSNILVALAVATFKVGLVAAYFMHLKGEKATIWRFLYFTVIFFAGLFLLTSFAWTNPIFGTLHNTH